MNIEHINYILNILIVLLYLQSFKSSSSIHNIDVSSSKDSKGKLTDMFKPSTLPK